MQCCLERLSQHWVGFSAVTFCPKSIEEALDRIFSYAIPRVLRWQCTWLFLMKNFLESFGQHIIGFSAVQSYPKSIKTVMSRIFSSAKLSGASRTTLQRVFTCAMLFGASWTTLRRGYCLGNIVPRVSPWTVKTLCSVVLESPENIA